MVINVLHLNGALAFPLNIKSTSKPSINNKSREPMNTNAPELPFVIIMADEGALGRSLH